MRLDLGEDHRAAAPLAIDDVDVARLRADHAAERRQRKNSASVPPLRTRVSGTSIGGRPPKPAPTSSASQSGSDASRSSGSGVPGARRARVQDVQRRRDDLAVAAGARGGRRPSGRGPAPSRPARTGAARRARAARWRSKRGPGTPTSALIASSRTARTRDPRLGCPRGHPLTIQPVGLTAVKVPRRRATVLSANPHRRGVHARGHADRVGRTSRSRTRCALLDALSATGLQTIVVGSFVSPKYTPQMAAIDELLATLSPRDPGVTYTAVALNDKGRERARRVHARRCRRRPAPPAALLPPLRHVHPTQRQHQPGRRRSQRWPRIVEPRRGARGARGGIAINAAWGSNFEGRVQPRSSGWRCCIASTRCGTGRHRGDAR